MDGGACWATVHGVTQSRTRLKQLSSSSSAYLMGFFSGLNESVLINLLEQCCVCIELAKKFAQVSIRFSSMRLNVCFLRSSVPLWEYKAHRPLKTFGLRIHLAAKPNYLEGLYVFHLKWIFCLAAETLRCLIIQWTLDIMGLGSADSLIQIFFNSSVQFSSVQLLSQVRLFASPQIPARQASLSITNSQNLLKLMSIELVMPSNHLILCCPRLLPPSVFPSIRVFSNESVLCIRWPKCWSFSFSTVNTPILHNRSWLNQCMWSYRYRGNTGRNHIHRGLTIGSMWVFNCTLFKGQTVVATASTPGDAIGDTTQYMCHIILWNSKHSDFCNTCGMRTLVKGLWTTAIIFGKSCNIGFSSMNINIWLWRKLRTWKTYMLKGGIWIFKIQMKTRWLISLS